VGAERTRPITSVPKIVRRRSRLMDGSREE
jgi:hypothetical protein